MSEAARINQPGGLLNPGWFKVLRGDHAGEWHISAWYLTALYVSDFDHGGQKWQGLAICPICQATILIDDNEDSTFSRRTVAHERWHARTDLPVPDGKS